jgi:hypothetical protein
MRIALLIAVVALAGNALAAKPVKQGTVNAPPSQSQPGAIQPSQYEQTAKAYSEWKENVKGTEDPWLEVRDIYEAHWQRALAIADRVDKKQLTEETAAKLTDISMQQARDETVRWAEVPRGIRCRVPSVGSGASGRVARARKTPPGLRSRPRPTYG